MRLSGEAFSFLLAALGKKACIVSGLSLALGHPLLFEGHKPALPLEADRGNKALDLGRLESLLLLTFLTFLNFLTFLWDDLSAIGQHVFADVILFAESEEFADLGGSFRAKAAGNGDVSEAGQFAIALFEDDQIETGKIRADDTPTNRLLLPLAVSSGSITWMIFAEQQSDSPVQQDTLHHRETLFIIATSDFEDVAFKFIS